MTDLTCQRWLHGYCAAAEHVSAGVVVLAPTSPRATPTATACWPVEMPPAPPLVAAAAEALKRAGPVYGHVRSRRDTSAANAQRVIAVPLHDTEQIYGALALAVRGAGPLADEMLLQELTDASVSLVDDLATTQRSPGADAAEVLCLQSSLLQAGALEQACVALASELARQLDFYRVSLGLLEVDDQVSFVGVSHNAEVGARQALVRALAAAMQEAADQAATVGYPQLGDGLPRIVQAHAALAASGPGSVLSVPLAHDGHLVGVLCFERAAPLTPAERQRTEAVARGLASALALKRQAESSWQERARAQARARWQRLVGGHRLAPTLALASLGLALALLVLLPVPYRVGAPARIEGAVQRGVAAAADGFVQAVHVRPGDEVKAGDLLVEMAAQDLLLEQRKWDAELAQHDSAAAAALTSSDRAQFAIAHAKAEEARSQLALVQAQLARTRLTAPIAGIVIGGDLTQSLGAPVQRGQVLLTLAPRNEHRLLLVVEDRDIAALRPGQRGQVALAAMPQQPLAFQVRRVTPVAVTADGRNGFEVEAQLDAAPAGLRPGLHGVAKVEAGERSLLWIAARPVADALRLLYWRWSPWS